jgi:hypothetical protein
MDNNCLSSLYKFSRASARILWTPEELLKFLIAESNASRAQAKRPWFTSKEDLDKIKILKSIKIKTTYF